MEKIKWIEEYINEANNFLSTGEYEQALKILNKIQRSVDEKCRLRKRLVNAKH